jgi:hypothetical protein
MRAELKPPTIRGVQVLRNDNRCGCAGTATVI